VQIANSTLLPENNHPFSSQYERARESGYHRMANKLIVIMGDGTNYFRPEDRSSLRVSDASRSAWPSSFMRARQLWSDSIDGCGELPPEPARFRYQ
jgi:hypothetical protein